MERVGSGSNWLGQKKQPSSRKQYFGEGDLGWLGPLPVDHCDTDRYSTRDRNQTRSSMLSKGNTRQAFPSSPRQWDSDNTEVLGSSGQAGLLDSLANAGESSHNWGFGFKGRLLLPTSQAFCPSTGQLLASGVLCSWPGNTVKMGI